MQFAKSVAIISLVGVSTLSVSGCLAGDDAGTCAAGTFVPANATRVLPTDHA